MKVIEYSVEIAVNFPQLFCTILVSTVNLRMIHSFQSCLMFFCCKHLYKKNY